jgi:hypothetical protein
MASSTVRAAGAIAAAALSRHLLGLGDQRHHVVQLGVAAQHGLVVPGPVGLFQPVQNLDLQLGQVARVGQRAPHGPVPLRPGQRVLMLGHRHDQSLATIPERNLEAGFVSLMGGR